MEKIASKSATFSQRHFPAPTYDEHSLEKSIFLPSRRCCRHRKQHCAMSHHTLARNFLIDERKQHRKEIEKFRSSGNFPFSFFLSSSLGARAALTPAKERVLFFANEAQNDIFLFVMSSLRWTDEEGWQTKQQSGSEEEDRASRVCSLVCSARIPREPLRGEQQHRY